MKITRLAHYRRLDDFCLENSTFNSNHLIISFRVQQVIIEYLEISVPIFVVIIFDKTKGDPPSYSR